MLDGHYDKYYTIGYDFNPPTDIVYDTSGHYTTHNLLYVLNSRIEINYFETISGLLATHHDTFIHASLCLHRPAVVEESSALHRSGKMHVLT